MKMEIEKLINIIESRNGYHKFGSVEFCSNKIKLFGECECPFYPCSESEYNGCSCTCAESVIECVLTISEETVTRRQYLNTAKKYDEVHPKTRCMDFDKFMQLLKIMKKYDCLIDNGRIVFLEPMFMKNKKVFEIKME